MFSCLIRYALWSKGRSRFLEGRRIGESMKHYIAASREDSLATQTFGNPPQLCLAPKLIHHNYRCAPKLRFGRPETSMWTSILGRPFVSWQFLSYVLSNVTTPWSNAVFSSRLVTVRFRWCTNGLNVDFLCTPKTRPRWSRAGFASKLVPYKVVQRDATCWISTADDNHEFEKYRRGWVCTS